MFIGHYGVSFALKARNKSIPLWILFIAVQLVDVLWGVFVLTGIEKVRIVPGITATNPFDLYYMPYTHSLVGALFWSAVGFGIYYLIRSRRKDPSDGGADSRLGSSLLVGLAVFSHWALDLVVHRPDLPLYDDTLKIGLGLWNYPAMAFGLEIILLFGGMFLYMRSTSASNVIGKFGMPVLGVVLIAAQSVVFFGAPPESPAAAAVTALLAYFLFAGATFWLARQRH
ncbi:MAG TPA: hypothetical protein VFZ49_10760 [Pyrinomonadaceae bacterium]